MIKRATGLNFHTIPLSVFLTDYL